MVGGPTERSRSLAPTVKELVAWMTQRSTSAVEPQAPAMGNQSVPSATANTEESAVAQAEEEASAEAVLVDISSILGAPTMTVVRSSL
jgi:hypothetical protein